MALPLPSQATFEEEIAGLSSEDDDEKPSLLFTKETVIFPEPRKDEEEKPPVFFQGEIEKELRRNQKLSPDAKIFVD